MANVELRAITKRFRGVTALRDVSFTVADGEFFVLLGPTGAGKTTTLRVIAGLEKQDGGSILFDGEPMDSRSPAERDVAFVFQQYSLYPTMTVFDNLAFPLRSPLRKLGDDEIKRRVTEAAEKLRISHLLQRKTERLSGGEMQRVSIGRAIVRQPRVFLMDEPLSNLDAKLRESLRVELQHIQKKQHSTTLFVTHDQVEALTLADRIGVLREGRLIQVGAPREIYDRPANLFVAQSVGTPRINLFPATFGDGKLRVNASAIALPLPLPGNGLPTSASSALKFRINGVAYTRNFRLDGALDHNSRPATYADVLTGWQDDANFRSFFNDLLADCPYSAFRWEMPPVTTVFSSTSKFPRTKVHICGNINLCVR